MQRFATALLASAMFLPTFDDPASAEQVRAERLLGGNENPPVVSDGSGSFRARLHEDRISFRLRYDVASDDSDVLQAHLHIANPGNNGGIVAFLCSNVEEPPPPTDRLCPDSPGEVSGDIFAEDVMTVTDGVPPNPVVTIIEARNLEGLKRLIEQGSVYANVHTDDHMGGEIRGQLEPRRR
jgi:CHRD domain